VPAETWQAVLDLRPTDSEALEALHQLHERNKEWEALAGILEQEFRLQDDDDEQVQILEKLGHVYGDRMKDAASAVDIWRRVLSLAPAHPKAQEALKRAFLEAGDWDALTEHYAARDAWKDLVRVLESQVGVVGENELKVELLTRAASVWRDQIGDMDRSIRAVERVLQFDETNLEAALALIPVYEEKKNWKKLVGCHEVRFQHTADAAERREVLTTLAGLSEEKVSDLEGAFKWLALALEAEPTDADLRADVHRLAHEVGGWEHLAELYANVRDGIEDELDARAIDLARGRILAEELGRLDEARELFDRVVAADPDSPDALQALEVLHKRTGQWAELLAVLERELGLATEESDRRRILLDMALVQEEQLDSQEDSIETYRVLRSEQPEDLDALRNLRRLYTTRDDAENLADVLRQELSVLEAGAAPNPEELTGLRFDLAGILLHRLDQAEEAIDSLRQVLDTNPLHEEAVAELEGMLDRGPLVEPIAAVLEPVYENGADWEKLVRLNEHRLEEMDDPVASVELLLTTGQIQDQRLFDAPGAYATYGLAFRTDPEDERCRTELERLADGLDAWAELVAWYSGATEAGMSGDLALKLHSVVARVQEDKIGDTGAARAAWEAVLATEPSTVAALEALERLCTKEEDWGRLLEVHARRRDLSEDQEEREALAFKMATLQEDLLGQAEEAIETYRGILAENDSSERALKALDRLYQGLARWDDLAENLQAQLVVEPMEDEQLTLRNRLAAICEGELGRAGAAVESYREVLAQDPNDDTARSALERLLDHDEQRDVAAKILEPIYEADGHWAKLVTALGVQVDECDESAERIDLLTRMLSIQEQRLSDHEGAFATGDRAFAEDAGNEGTRESIRRLATILDNWSAVVDLYEAAFEEELEEPGDSTLAGTLLRELAVVYEQKQDDLDGARRTLVRLVETDPEDLDAMGALERVYLQTEAWGDLVGVLEARAEITADPDEKRTFLMRAATLHEEMLEQPERAIEVLRQVTDLDPAAGVALQSLERLYRSSASWGDLVGILQRRADAALEPEARAELLLAAGEVQEERISEPHDAISTFRNVLEIDPSDVLALAALDRLHGETEQWLEQLEIIERRIEGEFDPGKCRDLARRVAGLWETRLDDALRAIDGYRDLLESDPTDAGPSSSLLEMVRRGSESTAAAEVLLPHFKAQFEWDQAVEVQEALLPHLDDPLGQIALLREIADTRQREMDDIDGAFDALARALAVDPQAPVAEEILGALEAVSASSGDWDRYVALLEAEAERAEADPALASRLIFRVAGVMENSVGDAEGAIDRFRRALELDSDRADALDALDRLFERESRWGDLAGVLGQEITASPDVDERIDLMTRLATLHETALEDVDAAIEIYRDILLEEPGHAGTVVRLERLLAEGHASRAIAEILDPLYREQPAWEKWIGVQEVILGSLDGRDERLMVLREVAAIVLQELADPERALQWFGRALQEDPSDESLAAEVERLAGETGAWEKLCEIYLEAHERVADDGGKGGLLLKLARVFEAELQDPERAEQCYQGVLEHDGQNAGALAALDRLYRQDRRWADLSEVLQRRIDQGDADEEKGIELLFRLAELRANELGDLDLAVGSYRGVLAKDSQHAGALKALQNIYLAREEWEALFQVYEGLVDIAAEDSAKADIYARMANLAAEQLERPSDAIYMWRKVTEILGEDRRSLAALADLHEAEVQWDDLVEVLERLSRVTDVPEQAADVLVRLGLVLTDKLDRGIDALDCWQQVAAIRPDDAAALTALRRLHRQSEDWHELSEVLEQLIDLRPPEVVGEDNAGLAELHAELGSVRGEHLMRPEEAVSSWRQVLALRPDNLEALTALESLHEGTGEWAACVDVLEMKADLVADGAEKVAVLIKVAEVCEQRTSERERAVTFYERAGESDPTDQTVSAALERLYTEDASHDKLLVLLLTRLESTTDTDARIDLLRNAASLCEEHLDSAEKAFFCMVQAWQERTEDEDLTADLERLAAAANEWETVLDLYEAVLPTVQGTPRHVDLNRRIGRIYADHLEASEEAISHLEEVRAATDPDGEIHTEALESLEGIYRKAGHWDKLVGVLEERVSLAGDADTKAELLNRMGLIWEENVQDLDRAVAAYRQALHNDPADETALGAMERIHTRREEWKELIDVLGRRAEASVDPASVVRHRLRTAELWETALGVPERAIGAYNEVLAVEPGQGEACRALERLYIEAEKWQELTDVYRFRIGVVEDATERNALLVRLALVEEEQFQRPPEAIDAYENVLATDPIHMEAIRALERLYVQMERWDPLVDTYRRHLDAIQGTPEAEQALDLLGAIGSVQAHQLEDTVSAIETYSSILEQSPGHQASLEALAQLHEKQSDWPAVVDALQKQAGLSDNPDEIARLWVRIGQVERNYLGEAEKAVEHYYAALDSDPRCIEAMDALREIFEEQGDWQGVVRMLKRKEDSTVELQAKAAVLLEIGTIYQDKLDDAVAATDYFERCATVDSENVEAAQPLVEMYLREQKWARAEPLLEMLIRKMARSREAEDLHLLHYQAGIVAENLNKSDQALRHFRSAYELDATHLATLEGLGRLLFAREDWDRGFKIYQTILVHHRETLSPEQTVDIFYRLGQIKLKVGERSRARSMFEKALEVQPHDKLTLEALVDLHEKQGDWERVVRHKQAMVEGIYDGTEQFALLVEVGDIWREQLRNSHEAIACYRQALERQPQSRVVLNQLLKLHNQEEHWDEAVQILEQIIEVEEDPAKLGKLHNTVAVIYRDKLSLADQSVEHFNLALKNDPGLLKAFEAIDKILTNQKDWEELERNYRRMLKRIKDADLGGPELESMMWRNLGEIYRTRMGRLDEAATAFAEASRLQPDNEQLHEIVADLYERGDDADKAIEKQHELIKISPFRVDAYRKLNQLYMQKGAYDEAWCMCAALSFLREARPEEDQFYRQYVGPTFKSAKQAIDGELWSSSIVHPANDERIGSVFALLAHVNPYATTLKNWGLKKKDVHDLAKPLLFNKTFHYASETLGLAGLTPEVYLKREQHTGMRNGATEQWSLIIGADMLSGKADRELAYQLGRQLTLYRMGHYMAGLGLPRENLKILFFAAWQVTNPAQKVPVPGDSKQFQEVIQYLASMPKPRLVDLQKVVHSLLNATGGNIDLSSWVRGVDYTADRLGLILSGDLETSCKLIKANQHPISKATPKERIKELVLYSISNEHFATRNQLGTDIGG
jgi:tetratricopeptide (TPR) repeat protein